MSQFFQIHPENPQSRLITQAIDIVRQGGVIVYPTDSGYALGCLLGDKSAMERIRQIRKLGDKHHFTLMCSDLSQVANYAKVNNTNYRLVKSLTPGAYTFILPATKEVPRRLQHPKRKTIGLRIPDNVIAQDLISGLGEPLMSVSLILPGDEFPMAEPYEIRDVLEHAVDLVIDGGYCGIEATSVLDLEDDIPVIMRRGAGDVSALDMLD
ncbi:MAG: threonylcarbamoyl-AMP synthase [Gammaproteobacteria bacterium]|nr:threonylcarbamoyl-AMP synthase [Gammaproteobacteria bacterium]